MPRRKKSGVLEVAINIPKVSLRKRRWQTLNRQAFSGRLPAVKEKDKNGDLSEPNLRSLSTSGTERGGKKGLSGAWGGEPGFEGRRTRDNDKGWEGGEEGSAGEEILVDGMKRTGSLSKDREVRGWSKAVDHRGGSMDNTRTLRGPERA